MSNESAPAKPSQEVPVCVPGQQPRQAGAPPRSAGEALAALDAALGYLANTNAAALTTIEQADCLRGLERAESVRIAARSTVLAAFAARRGHEDDGQGSARSWLRWQARITPVAAGAATAWVRRLAAHPAVRDALAAGLISPSWARAICDWTDLLPDRVRGDADVILLAAAAAGADLDDLAALAEEMRARTASPDTDPDGGGPGGRSLRLDLHYRGAGKLSGDLTPRCAAALRAVLDALGKRTGPDDLRSQPERDHDALEDALQRLLAAKCVSDRAGQPTQIQLVMTLDQLLRLNPAAAAGQPAAGGQPGPAGGLGRRGEVAAREAERRALFPEPRDLTGPRPDLAGLAVPGPLATPGELCDATIVPIVTGHADHDLLDRLARDLLASQAPSTVPSPQSAKRSIGYARELILSHAVALLSGPGGLASRLRTGTLAGPAASISLPLDVGTATDTIPPHIRRAVILRDKHCSAPGCLVPPSGCQVHHLIPRSEGGTTSVQNCGLYCLFHHLIVIHQWGWTIARNADGTSTAVSSDGTRVHHSHDPPAAA